jgi:ATP-dependent Clp protease ATP-binding subunit ClpC
MTDTREPLPTPRYSALVAEASWIAADMGHQHVGAEHLFLAIIDDPAAVPTQVLGRLADVNQVDTELRVLMAAEQYRTSRPFRPPDE